MTMKIAAAFTVALVAVIGLAVAQDFNDFNNFDDFGDDNSRFFGASSFGLGGGLGGGLGIPQSSISVGPAFSVGGGFPSAAINPIPLPAPQQQSSGIGSFLPFLFLIFFLLFNNRNNNQDTVLLLNGTLF